MNKKSSYFIFSVLALLILIPLSLLLYLPNNAQTGLLKYCFQGKAAYRQGDYSLFLKYFQKAISLAPTNPYVMYELARAYALQGNKRAAVAFLKKAILTGYCPNLDDRDFLSLRDSDDFKVMEQRVTKLKTPVSASQIAFRIPEKDLMPEGIAYDPVTEAFYLGSFYKRKIVSVAKSGIIEDFAAEMQDELWSVTGLKVDGKRRMLWVNTSALSRMKGSKTAPLGLAAVFKYNLDNRRLVKKYLLDERPTPHIFNDLVLDSQGDVFISDSSYGAVYRISQETDHLELFVRPRQFTYPNGITLSRDEKYLYVSHKEGATVIDLKTRACSILSHSDDTTLAEIDGLYFYHNTLVAIQNDNWRGRVIQFYLNDKSSPFERPDLISLLKHHLPLWNRPSYSVKASKIIESGNPLFMFPTTGVIVGDLFYYIANSQIPLLQNDGVISCPNELSDVLVLMARL